MTPVILVKGNVPVIELDGKVPVIWLDGMGPICPAEIVPVIFDAETAPICASVTWPMSLLVGRSGWKTRPQAAPVFLYHNPVSRRRYRSVSSPSVFGGAPVPMRARAPGTFGLAMSDSPERLGACHSQHR